MVGHYKAAAEYTQDMCWQNIYQQVQKLIKMSFANYIVLEYAENRIEQHFNFWW